MKLIDDCKGAWRHYSTQAMALGGTIQAAWVAYPDELKTALPPGTAMWVAKITAGILLLGIIGKFIDQTPKDKP